MLMTAALCDNMIDSYAGVVALRVAFDGRTPPSQHTSWRHHALCRRLACLWRALRGSIECAFVTTRCSSLVLEVNEAVDIRVCTASALISSDDALREDDWWAYLPRPH